MRAQQLKITDQVLGVLEEELKQCPVDAAVGFGPHEGVEQHEEKTVESQLFHDWILNLSQQIAKTANPLLGDSAVDAFPGAGLHPGEAEPQLVLLDGPFQSL